MKGILRAAALLLVSVPLVAQAGSDAPLSFDFAAMQQQPGLRLQASKRLVDVIVIDGAERP